MRGSDRRETRRHLMTLKTAILAVELLACAAVPLMALAVHAL
jgi:hypothetical protein